MNLSEQESALFYKLWYSIVWGINEKHKIIPRFKKPVYGTRVPVSLEDFAKVNNAMWDNPQWIDDFLSEPDSGEFTEEERSIIALWRKHFVKGRFILVKHLKKYSVLMTFGKNPTFLYGVYGITEPLKDALPYTAPFAVDLVLLPFGDKIIYSSIASIYSISFGPGYRASIKELYNETKEKYGIIEMLNGEIPVIKTQSEKPKKKITSQKPASIPATVIVPEGVNVPKVMAARYNQIAEIISDFCDEKLNEEYKSINLRALAKLCRKRPSPLVRGNAWTWAAGIVYAIGSNNFIFDRSQPINMTATEIAEWFGLAKSTAGSKASEVTKLLHLSYTNTEFLLKRIIANNPAIWYLEVNGFITDIRRMPREVQEQAFKKGLIPYIPDDEY